MPRSHTRLVKTNYPLPLVTSSRFSDRILTACQSLFIIREEIGQSVTKCQGVNGLSALEAAYIVLNEVGRPLHYQELTTMILNRNLWQTDGKTPAATLNSALALDIMAHGVGSRFVRVSKGIFGLAGQTLPETDLDPKVCPPDPSPTETTVPAACEPVTLEQQDETVAPAQEIANLSFPDAAEKILEEAGGPLNYREITRRALLKGLIITTGKTPASTLHSTVMMEIARDEKRGTPSRFERLDRGLIGLRASSKVGLDRDIEQNNHHIQKQLHQWLLSLSSKPELFELLIGQLLLKMGYQSIETTRKTGDGGIDVRGTLVIAEVIRIRLAIQAKCWKKNVHSPTVQQVRGSLGSNEQGLIITTSDYSSGARAEADRPNAAPVSLMNGKQLVNLLIEHELLVRRTPQVLLRLALEDLEDGTLATQ